MKLLPDPSSIGAVIVAGGRGSRFDPDTNAEPKQFRLLGGRPVLLWSIDALRQHPRIDEVIVVLPPEYCASPPDWIPEVTVVAGGISRSESVRNGLAALSRTVTDVAVHDGARPFVSRRLIDRLLSAADSHSAAIPGLPVTDTLKMIDSGGWIQGTVDREALWRVQTPQLFPAVKLRQYHDRAAVEGFSSTDDAGLFERYGTPVRIVEGERTNLKVTDPTDMLLAEVLLSGRNGNPGLIEQLESP